MKIAFLGTPDFAVPSLAMLYERGDTLCVFSQPDRPQGRHGELKPTPVKAYALEKGIPVYQFERIRSEEGLSALKAFAPDLMVTAAFGQLLSADNLAVPKYGCINVHGSLLPKYRGAAPIQWAVIDGEKETGITTMMTDIGMDTGDILLKRAVPIDPDETAGELYDRLALIGADVLKETLTMLESGTLTRIKQDPALATKCCMLKKEHGKLDFSQCVRAVHDRVRGVSPWPGAFGTLFDGTVIKIWKTAVPAAEDAPEGLPCGMCACDARGLFIGCADGAIRVTELQAPGGKRMDAQTFLRGKNLDGKRFV